MPAGEPVVLEGLIDAWPAVRLARHSLAALADYLRTVDGGAPVETFKAESEIEGRFFYDAALTGFNFERRQEPLSHLLDQLLAAIDDPSPPALYAGALPIGRHMPRFAAEHGVEGMVPEAAGRIWLGNTITVHTHYDASDNLACVVAGRRSFTLFAPDQIGNLYPGPLEFTPAGQPVSMASIDRPDFSRHPRFADALAAACVAELGPGDAIFIPALWWHHVRSTAPFNVLVNYWWSTLPPQIGSPMEALAHALLAIRHLPPAQRKAWRAQFDYYVFERPDEAGAHLPPHARGALGALTPQLVRHIKSFLQAALGRR